MVHEATRAWAEAAMEDLGAACPGEPRGWCACGEPEAGALNFRDTAGAWQGTLQEGRIFRSSQLYTAQVINNNGIKTIVDLRKLKEPCKRENDLTASVPSQCRVCCSQWQADGIANPRVLHVDLISLTLKMHIVAKMSCKMWWEVAKTVYKGDDPATVLCPAIADSQLFGFRWFYAAILEKSKDNIAKAMRVFAQASNYPILVHCMHGKDRTGLVVMLLLSVCGVPKESIVKDYTESDQQLRKGKEANELKMADYLQHDSVIAAPPKDIEGTLEHIEEKYGSVEGYLESCGVTPEEIQRIRANMVHERMLVCSESEPLKSSDGSELLSSEPSDSDAGPLDSHDGVSSQLHSPHRSREHRSKMRHIVRKAYRKVVGLQASSSAGDACIPILRHSSSVPNVHLQDDEGSGDD
ncbi:unnamed protein product [Ostreobium quekettii]|uniref:Tyrosine specific protein phosphatases domain-containing protein n=1 Tax=Ostreobium quekettii TaxID=121088 RepID=A0A8S1JEV2_9CHLO|nr:unnamed protein product [Ostreobium quekettii]|eukprot:evm.model.scf_17.4 EVM.evm.TU.scf_17.4   scf_17:65607-69940(+)